MSARIRAVAGAVHGRTHRSAPTRGGRYSETREIGVKRTLPQRGGTEPAPYRERSRLAAVMGTPPYGCNAGGAQQQADVGIGPYGRCGKFHQPPGPAAHSGASAPRSRGRGGNRSREHPQNVQQPRTIPQSRRSRASSLCTREPLGTGDADRRVASLFAMTVLILCHSEEAQRADVGIRPFYDGRATGRRT